MDIVLAFADDYVLDSVYGNSTSPYLQRDHLARQSLSLFVILTLGAWGLYFACGLANYYFIYSRAQNLGHHPFEGQMRAEITMAASAIPFMALFQVPVSLAEIHGYTKLYGPGEKYSWDDYGGWWYLPLNLLWFLVFTDFVIYWVHRWLHHPRLYKVLHKPHHLWKNPTPFASHAFHPLDGWLQGTAYHIFVVFFPMHKVVHLLALVFVNVWTNSIHDGCSFYPWAFINGAAHHTIHHTDFHYNYGQYFVFWDWVFGSYRDPREEGRVLHPEMQAQFEQERAAEANKACAASKKLQ